MAKAKKVTVKMLKDLEKGIVDEEQIGLILKSAKIEAQKMKDEGITEMPDDFILPINVDDDRTIIGIGAAVCVALRLICTDAAWKYIANDLINSFKDEEETN